MIDEADVKTDAMVYVGLGHEVAAWVVGLVKSGGRVRVRVRLYRTDIINDYPLCVVRKMTPSEIRALRAGADLETLPKQRQAKPWRKRLVEAANRQLPPSRARRVGAVALRDVAYEAGYTDSDVDAAVERVAKMDGGE